MAKKHLEGLETRGVAGEMSKDAKILHDFYALSKPVDIKQKGKEVIKSVVGQETAKKLKNMFGK